MSTATLTGPPRARRAPVKPWPPRWLTPVPRADLRRSDGPLYSQLVNATCRITKDSVAGPAGHLIRLRPWQEQLHRHLFARRPDGLLRHRVGLIGIARKNGKSGIGSGTAIGSMLLGPAGGEVYSCAGDRDQASIVFNDAKKMVEADEHLSKAIKVWSKVLEVPATGTTYRALSADAFTKEGKNPSAVIFDEVHVQPTRELWDVMAQAQGAREEPLMIGITTAGVKTDRTGRDSLCYSLYQYGVQIALREIDDPTFFMAWWEPRAGADAPHDDPRTWREANPGFDDLVSAADFESVVRRTEENEFRTKRCNQWVSSARAWLPNGRFESLADPARYPGGPPEGTRVVLAFDGSKSGDSTALLGFTVEERMHMFVVGIWEKDHRDPNWRVPRGEVKQAVRAAARRYDVPEVSWDDYMWQDAREELQDEGLPIEPYPQTPERMGRATQRFYEAAMDGTFSHDGDPRMTRHFANAVPKPTSRGFARITKESPDSPLRIDAAVTGVFGSERAEWWLNNGDPDAPNIW
ncbi:terminase large subunit domain-containing protein [Kineococcus gynurae]|uniref:Terminase large subunit domain-containing protein n=1 Tax=Kineococcus gynurae TaxID=452979 RepID=A0ABV5LWW6_9ACTN